MLNLLYLPLVAAKAKGISYFKNLSELNKKESPRLKLASKILKKRIMWELKEQENLFNLFENWNICISLTESFTMVPRMSRSGVFGLKKSKI